VRDAVGALSRAWTWLKAFFGVPDTYSEGVVNLALVDHGVWRCGQPVTATDWTYLKSLGITQVVKLNFDSEGVDNAPDGMTVHALSIQPEGDQDVWDDVEGVFVQPDRGNLSQALKVIREGGGVLVHCSHGHDRTGLVIGLYRVMSCGWTKEAAYEEMLQRGFHPELYALHEFWDKFKGTL
jgi:tyrosine-protein phosphatase SIW14